MATICKSSPWVVYYREVQALFSEDSSIKVFLDEENYELDIYVDGQNKAEALSMLLPSEKVYGNVTLKINIIPSNVEVTEHGQVSTYRKALIKHSDIFMTFSIAFSDNSALAFLNESTIPGGAKVCYVVFVKKVVQYFSDDLTDYFGLTSTLYQNIAKDVLKEDLRVFYSTDTNLDYC